VEPQLNAFQFINEALTRFESEFEGPLARFESEHGDKVLPEAFRKYVTSQMDGEVRRVEGWMEGLPRRTARKEAEKAGAYYDTLKKVAFVLHYWPSSGKPGGASSEQLRLCRKVAKVLVEKYGADPAGVDCLAD
jgi:hypothetical protein